MNTIVQNSTGEQEGGLSSRGFYELHGAYGEI